MKKTVKPILVRVLLTLLAVSMSLCGCNSPSDTTDTLDSNEAVQMTLVEGGESEYKIVIPSASSVALGIAEELESRISRELGARISVIKDTFPESEYEIVVGITSRDTPAAHIEALKTPDDYFVCVEGKKVFIYGFSEQALRDALAFFCSVSLDESTDKTMTVEEDLLQIHNSSNKYITVSEGGVSDYVISCDTQGEPYAKKVQKMLKEKLGITLPITKDTSTAKAILVGDMSTPAGKNACEKLPAVFDSGVVVSGDTVVLAANYESGMEDALDALESSIKSHYFNGRLMYPIEYVSVYDMKSEDMVDYLSLINNKMTSIKYLNSEISRIYTPDGSESAWYYSHHTFMTEFDGKFYVVYSSGRRNEDDCGQRIMLATSDNFKDWKTQVLVDSRDGKASELVLYCMGLYSDGEELTVFFHSWEYGKECVRVNPDGSDLRPEAGNITSIERCGPYYIKTKDGVTWSEPALVSGNLGDKLYSGNHNPIKLDSGRIMWAGFSSVAYTDDASLTTGWNGKMFNLADGEAKTNTLTESTVYQHKNGTLFLFSRTDGGTMIVAASTDDGKTWTDSYHTQIQDFGAKFQFGRLPDGRYYYLGNTDNKRSEIAIMISDDGISFDEWYVLADGTYTQMKDGMYKGGLYGYPTSYFDDTYMYVVYSLRKESVEVLRIPLSSIGVK